MRLVFIVSLLFVCENPSAAVAVPVVTFVAVRFIFGELCNIFAFSSLYQHVDAH